MKKNSLKIKKKVKTRFFSSYFDKAQKNYIIFVAVTAAVVRRPATHIIYAKREYDMILFVSRLFFWGILVFFYCTSFEYYLRYRKQDLFLFLKIG